MISRINILSGYMNLEKHFGQFDVLQSSNVRLTDEMIYRWDLLLPAKILNIGILSKGKFPLHKFNGLT